MATTRRSRLASMDINREIAYIVRKAQEHDGRIVTLGALIFFSTDTGDAWMLDPDDSLALCLARGGSALPPAVVETDTSFAVSWEATFRIDGSAMTFTDHVGNARTIVGYPTGEIRKAIRSVVSRRSR